MCATGPVLLQKPAPRGDFRLIFYLLRGESRLGVRSSVTTALQAALSHEQNFLIVRKRRTVTPLCLLAPIRALPYLHRRRTIVRHCSQGGVQVPTGGKGSDAKPASAFGPQVLGVSRSGVIPEPTV